MKAKFKPRKGYHPQILNLNEVISFIEDQQGAYPHENFRELGQTLQAAHINLIKAQASLSQAITMIENADTVQ